MFTRRLLNKICKLSVLIIIALSIAAPGVSHSFDQFPYCPGDDYTCEPPYLVGSPATLDFGAVNIGESRQLTFDAEYHVDHKGCICNPFWKVVCYSACYCHCDMTGNVSAFLALYNANFSISQNTVSITLPSEDMGNQEGHATVTVTFTPYGTGLIQGLITITGSDGAIGAAVQLVGMGYRPQPNINISPISLDFGSVAVGSTASQNILIFNEGDGVLNVSNISTTGLAFSSPSNHLTISPGGSANVSVVFRPYGYGNYSGQLSITSNDPDASSLQVNLNGTGAGASASIGVKDAGPVDFGGVVINTASTVNIPVSNNGNMDLNIFDISSDSPAFSILTPELTIGPGETQNIQISYNPSQMMDNSGLLSLKTNDPQQNTLSISLKGTGISDLDLKISKVEIFQTTPADHHLVAGKPVVVRVYIEGQKYDGSKITASGVDGVLKVRSQQYMSLNGPIIANTKDNGQKALSKNDTLNFSFVPTASARTGITVEINPESGARTPRLPENNYDNNVEMSYLRFNEQYAPQIGYIPINYMSKGLPLEQRVRSGADVMKAMYPVGNIIYRQLPPITYTKPVRFGDDMRNGINLLNALFLAGHLVKGFVPDKIFGWLPGTTSSESNYLQGLSYMPSRVGFAFTYEGYYKDTFAHELGHTYGLCHTHSPSCDRTNYDDGHKQTDVSPGSVGVNAFTWELKPPISSDNYYNCNAGGYADFMAYAAPYDDVKNKWLCSGQIIDGFWINPQRYEFLFERLRTKNSDWAYHYGCATNSSAQECVNAAQSAGDGEEEGTSGTEADTGALTEPARAPILVISGSIAKDGTAVIMPIYEAEGVPDMPDDPVNTGSNGYVLQILDSADRVLATYSLNLSPDGSFADIPNAAFSLAIPKLDGSNKVQVLQDGAVMAEMRATENPPAVEIGDISVTNGILSAEWTAHDEDQDELVFSVLYSSDGGKTFFPIAINLKKESLNYNTEFLGGSGAAMIRIMASDGMNTASADSNTFSISKKPPSIKISNPVAGETFFNNAPVTFEAVVNDAEDADLPDGSITWSSNIDGALGNGRTLFVPFLSIGTHEIEAIVRDNDGNEAMESVTISVVDGLLAPRANAASYQEVLENATAGLDGSGSTGASETDTLSFYWEQTSGPAADVSGANEAIATFNAPMVDSDTFLKFKLSVTNSGGIEDTAITSVLVKNTYYPLAMLDQQEIIFNDTTIGGESTASFVITNTGSEPLLVSRVVSNSEAFTVSAENIAIESGGKETINVSFRPPEEVTYKGMLEVVSNSAGEVNAVYLAGRALPPEALFSGDSLVPKGVNNANSEGGDMVSNWPSDPCVDENAGADTGISGDNRPAEGAFSIGGGGGGCGLMSGTGEPWQTLPVLLTVLFTIGVIFYFRRSRTNGGNICIGH